MKATSRIVRCLNAHAALPLVLPFELDRAPAVWGFDIFIACYDFAGGNNFRR